jgi:SPP1 gp7 family putative phage head morphogenesis protein
MRYDLKAIAKQAGYRRKVTKFRIITPPNMLALEYYRMVRPALERAKAQVPSIMAQYERTLAQMTTDSPSDVQAEISAIEVFGQSIGIVFSAAVLRWIEQVERWHRGKWSANVLTPVNVNLGTFLTAGDVAQTLESFLAANVALIKDINAEQVRKISDIVFRGLQARTPPRQVGKEISEVTGFARKRTLRIAGDQLQKLTSALDAERMRQAGLDEYIWNHSDKVNFRPEHKARDGNTYKIGEFGSDDPGMKPFCGCKRGPVMSFL